MGKRGYRAARVPGRRSVNLTRAWVLEPMDNIPVASDAVFDLVLLAVIGISLGLGLFRGLVRELLSLLAWILAIWLAYLYANPLAERLLEWLDSVRLSYLVSFLLVFLGTLVGLSIVGRLVYHLFRISGLTAMDRFFGAIFGLTRALILILVLVTVLGYVGATKAPWYQDSEIARYLEPLIKPAQNIVVERVFGGNLKGDAAPRMEGQ